MPVLVREKDGFEIMDGEQRYTAMKELGFSEIWIYNKGEISDEEAKATTIWWQVQVPFDQIELAPLVVELSDLGVLVPYSENEIEDFRTLSEFDFTDYDTEHTDEDGLKTLSFRLNEEQYETVNDALEKAKNDNTFNSDEALVIISREYLSK